MESLLNKKVENPKQLSPQTLAFVGDTVYDLLVRGYLASTAQRPVGELNRQKVKLVNCEAQAEAVKKLTPSLTEEEIDIYRRGRNAFTKNTPKNSSVADYHSATGLEALFGFLYLKGDIERIRTLFEIIEERG